MARVIEKLALHNFRRFDDFEMSLAPGTNLVIGDNESGKSSLLEAIDLVLGGRKSRVESVGLERLMNATAVEQFLGCRKEFASLPTMWAEVYLSGESSPDLNGRNNSMKRECDGLRLLCEPMDDYSTEIAEILSDGDPNFPFEYYSIKFLTFSGEAYTGYRRFMKHLLLDGSQINSEHAMRSYVREMYRTNADEAVMNRHQNEYRKVKRKFCEETLDDVNSALDEYKFSVATSKRCNLETDLTITEADIPIENRGKGRQCFIKTEFALNRGASGRSLDVLLIEEPENHLSHTNTRKLIQLIRQSEDQQLIVATHSSLICSRLDLRNAIMLNSSCSQPATLAQLSSDTARFFVKAPDNNVLELILSSRAILVEGDAEFILFAAMYEAVAGESLDSSEVHVISVDGTSFKRYLELAKLLQIRVGVIRDNDGDAQRNCVERYADYTSDKVAIFYEEDDELTTFEKCIYHSNEGTCDRLFSGPRIKATPVEYMIAHKTEAALRLLDDDVEIVVPGYIKKAIEWNRQ